jgi:hypothetical protein
MNSDLRSLRTQNRLIGSSAHQSIRVSPEGAIYWPALSGLAGGVLPDSQGVEAVKKSIQATDQHG